MLDDDRIIDPLPDSFESEEAAGEFWDNHSLMDYEKHLEAADDVTFEITERIFEVRVAEDIFENYSNKQLRSIGPSRRLLMRFCEENSQPQDE